MRVTSNSSQKNGRADYFYDTLNSFIPVDSKGVRIKLISIVVVLLLFITLPFYIDADSFFAYYLFICFIYITLSQGWNLVAGYTGQISLGTHAFFALGAYTTAIIWLHDITKTWYYFDPFVMLLSGVVPTVFAIIVGIPTLARLHGDYFSFGTLAAAEVLRIVILRGGKFTEGAMGLRLPAGGFTTMRPYYWTALLLACLATASVFLITRSRIGLALKAINEDETSASSHGINILYYKVLAFAVSSFIMGVCGSLYGYYLFMISPGGVMNLNWMFLPILVCILGGNGTVLGPVIGAFLVGALFSYTDVYVGQIHPMVSGILIVLVMKFLPTGLIGLKNIKLFHRKTPV